MSTALAQFSPTAERLYDERQYGRAEEAFLKSGKASAEALYNAGNAAYQQGHYERAARLYISAADKSVSLRPDAWYNAGNAYLRMGKYAEAVAAYERSLRLQPARTDAKRNLSLARKLLHPEPPSPPPPPPPPLPPPPPAPFLDPPRRPNPPEVPRPMSASETKQRLQEVVEREEGKNARLYRAMAPRAESSRQRKTW